jgi:hypothetical protein
MGKVDGSLLKLSGNIYDMNFYVRNGKPFYRKKSNLNKERVDTDPAFARSRACSNEFANASRFTKILFDASSMFSKGIRDSGAYNRLMSVMNKIKEYDTKSGQGKRSPIVGILDSNAHQLLMDYQFNEVVSLKSVFFSSFELNENGHLIIKGLNPVSGILAPKNADFYSLAAGRVDVDVSSGACDVVWSNIHQGALTDSISDIALMFDNQSSSNNVRIYMVKLSFYELCNGQQYPFNGKNGVVCGFVKVLSGDDVTE